MNLSSVVRAYRACFRAAPHIKPPWWSFWRRGELTPPGEEVLRELARICYATRTTAHKDSTAMAVAEGRRQVWLHIASRLNLTDADIERLTTKE